MAEVPAERQCETILQHEHSKGLLFTPETSDSDSSMTHTYNINSAYVSKVAEVVLFHALLGLFLYPDGKNPHGEVIQACGGNCYLFISAVVPGQHEGLL